MVIKESTQIEKVIKEGNQNKFSGKTTAKDFRSYMEHRIGVHVKRGNEEFRQYDMEILRAYNYFNPRKEVQVNANQWKGKSSIEILKQVDKLIIIKYQKETEESEPKEIRTEVTKEELGALIGSIKKLVKDGVEELETKDIAYHYCYALGLNDMLNGDLWKNVFSNRSLHNKLTLALNALSQLGFTTYKKGKTRLLNKDLSIQLVLL